MVLESSVQVRQKYVAIRPLILAVDDDEDNLLVMAYTLELFGFSFIGAENGRTALSLAKSYQPDMILLDIHLPDINGIELLYQIKQDPQMRQIPVIAVTGLAKAADRDRILAAGCVDYVRKPFMLDDLEATICRHLSVIPYFLPPLPPLNQGGF